MTDGAYVRRRAGVLAVLLFASAGARGEVLLPIDNQGVLARSFALPQLGEAQVLPEQAHELRFALDWTNEYFADANESEALTLDAETQRYSIDARLGLAHGFDVGVTLPLLVTGGGVLDNAIQSWHGFFGLPNGGREDAPNNRYLVSYQHNGQTLLNVDKSATGLGDVELSGGWQAARDVALRAMLKLPTGDANQLMGGNTGGALWADYDPFHGSARWFGFISGGGSLNARGQVLGAQQQTAVAFAGVGSGYRLWQPFSLMTQLYAHSHLYEDSRLKALRRDGLQLAIGGRYALTPHTALSFGFQEDLITNSSPDVSFHIDVNFLEPRR